MTYHQAGSRASNTEGDTMQEPTWPSHRRCFMGIYLRGAPRWLGPSSHELRISLETRSVHKISYLVNNSMVGGCFALLEVWSGFAVSFRVLVSGLIRRWKFWMWFWSIWWCFNSILLNSRYNIIEKYAKYSVLIWCLNKFARSTLT